MLKNTWFIHSQVARTAGTASESDGKTDLDEVREHLILKSSGQNLEQI